LDAESPLIRRVARALEAMGEPSLVLHAGGGGSDANILNARGIAAVPISTGMQGVHTTDEHVAVADMVQAARLVLHALDVAEQ
jgi:tripeptide aminopeptidase